MKLYKCTKTGGKSIYAKGFEYFLPKGKRPGKWMPEVKELIECESGYHVAQCRQLIEWLDDEIYLVEGRGEHVRYDNKQAFSQIRFVKKFDTWNERTQRLFAADCAEHVLKHFITHYPDDDRPAKVIQAARDFANGLISCDAARSAAISVASSVAWAARRAAGVDKTIEWQWQTKRLFEYLDGKRGRKQCQVRCRT